MGCLQVLSPAKMADDEIGKILSKIQLQTLMSRFRDQKLTINSICQTLTDSQLVDLGLLTIGDRIRFRSALQAEPEGQHGHWRIMSSIEVSGAFLLLFQDSFYVHFHLFCMLACFVQCWQSKFTRAVCQCSGGQGFEFSTGPLFLLHKIVIVCCCYLLIDLDIFHIT